MSSDLMACSFDRYQRYCFVRDVVDGMRDDRPLTILDVGGFPGLMLDFLPRDEVLVVDLYESDMEHYQQANALALPFEDGSFDIVTTLDVYEHVEACDRDRFLAEITRVARHAVILAAPFHSEEVASFENLCNAFYKGIRGADYPWLKEHIENGLPPLPETVEKLRRLFPYVSAYSNGYLPRWCKMLEVGLNFEDDANVRPYLVELNRFYNEKFYQYDNKSPSYRKILVASRQDTGFAVVEKPEDETSLQNELVLDRLIQNLQRIQMKRVSDCLVKGSSRQLDDMERQLAVLTNSLSWRITGPLRWVRTKLMSR